ncbi:MAG TPA: hypothetical protein VLS90_21525 [Thermodesulfobacteriota bacterium]|nr:hypothetical protein [Thermodesulfobacteriota bacterium]
MTSRWEYQITRYQIEELAGEEDLSGPAFFCDKKGQCLPHDTTGAAADLIRDALNEQGKSGWELVQFGYHKSELMCVWKRMLD